MKMSAGSVSSWKVRADMKNQSLSFLIGPPSDASKLDSLSMPSADFRPRAFSSSVRLSVWKLLF